MYKYIFFNTVITIICDFFQSFWKLFSIYLSIYLSVCLSVYLSIYYLSILGVLIEQPVQLLVAIKDVFISFTVYLSLSD